MSDPVTLALIGGLLGGGGLLAKMIESWASRRDPRSVEVALAQDSVATAGLTLEMLRDEMDGHRDRLAELELNREQDRAEITGLRTQMSAVKGVLRRHLRPIIVWVDDGADYPAPPIPQELRDLAFDDY